MRCGLAEQRAREVLLPLLRSALDNLSTRPPARALTGPFARADVATVKKHLAALKNAREQEAAAVYCLLGRLSLRLAATQTDATARREIERALEEHS
jgi:predicted short-subunit dehydrogenase-like oxidoreductase (DUF2520 family)